jgi:ATP-binding cassette subfamily C protein LapB
VSDDRIIPFDLHAGGRPQVAAAIAARMQAASLPQPAPRPEPAPPAVPPAAEAPAAPRILRPAPPPEAPAAAPPPPTGQTADEVVQLATVMAGLAGATFGPSDLSEQLVKAGVGGRPLAADLARALTAAGLPAQVERLRDLGPAALPALAEMTNGEIVLVLSRTEAGVEVYDPAAGDLRTAVPWAEFSRPFSGRLVRARLTLADLEARHGEATALPHWFWSEFRHYRRQFAEVAAGSLFANILAVAIALFSLQVYDRVIPYQSEPTLWVLALGVLMAVLLEGVLKVARAQMMDLSGKRIELAVQDRLMTRLLGMKPGRGDRKPSEIFSAMREFGAVREFFTASTIGTLADLPFLFVFFFLVASIAGNVVWILIAGAMLMVLPGLLLQKRMMELTVQAQGASTRAARLLYETVFEHETVTTQRGQDRARRIWNELNALGAAKTSEQRRLTTLLTTWAQAVQQATYVGAVVAGTYLVFTGDFTVGTIIATGILVGRTLGPLAQVSAMLARWSNTRQALDALDAVANAAQAEEPGRSYLRRERLAGAFELRGIEFRFDPQAPVALDIAAMAVPAGQHVAVLGANGSGKSTLLRLMAGLIEPQKGRVMIDGLDLGQIHPRDLRRSIGYLGQEVRLVAGTLRDNLNLSQMERDDARLMAALDFAGLGPFVRSHPRGLDVEVRELGEGLSVGQRQSIGWARMWLQDPAVVLLDEPTAALDQTLEATMVSRLATWLQGRTAIVATHRVPILALTTRTLILQGGKLAVDGPKEAVLAHLSKMQGGAAR